MNTQLADQNGVSLYYLGAKAPTTNVNPFIGPSS
jgi:hypothetical protein